MDEHAQEYIRTQLKLVETPDDWNILIDVVEESGPAEDVIWRWEWIFVEYGSFLGVLRGLLDSNRPYARELIAKLFPVKEYERQALPADAVNIPKCGEDWYQNLRRDQLEWAVGEQGNLETKPWPVVSLHKEPAEREYGASYVVVTVPNPDPEMPPLQAYVTLEDQHGRPTRAFIGTVYPGDGRLPTWADEEEIIQRGVEMIEANRVTHAWRNQDLGEGIRLNGIAYGEWLWMDSAPDGYPRGWDGDFRTTFTDGGGYQTADPEYLLDLKTLELWARVENGSHGADTECPNGDLRNGDRDESVVMAEDTQCGEYPGEKCRYCDEDVGEEHGSLSSDGNETVYRLIPSEVEED